MRTVDNYTTFRAGVGLARERSIPIAIASALLPLAIACGGDSAPTPPSVSTGSISITLSTTGILPDPTLIVTLDGGVTRTPPSNGTATFTGVAPGSHVIAVSDIAANCHMEDVERSVTVTAGQTTQVSISVECGRLIFVGGWAGRAFVVLDDVSFTERLQGLTDNYNPLGAKLSQDGRTIFFSMALGGGADGGFGMASTETLEFLERIPLSGDPLGVALSPDETEAWVLHYEGAVSWVDIVARTAVHRLDFQGSSSTRDMATLPDGSRLYVPDEFQSRLYVIDTAARRLLRTVTTPHDAVAVAVAPDGSRVYVRTRDFPTNTNRVLVLDPATNAIVQSADLPDAGLSILADPNGASLFVTYVNEERVARLDATTFVETGSVTLAAPSRLFMSADRTRLYVTQEPRQLTVLDPETLEILQQADVGPKPWSVVVYPPH